MRAELSYLLHLPARLFYVNTIYELALPASKSALFVPFHLKIPLPLSQIPFGLSLSILGLAKPTRYGVDHPPLLRWNV